MKRVPKFVWIGLVVCLIVGGGYFVLRNVKVITSLSSGEADDK